MKLKASVELGYELTGELAPGFASVSSERRTPEAIPSGDFGITWGKAEPPVDFPKSISDVSSSSWVQASRAELIYSGDSGIYAGKALSGIDFPESVPDSGSWGSWRSWTMPLSSSP